MTAETGKSPLAGLKSLGMASSLAATVFRGLGHAPLPGMFKWDPVKYAEELRQEKRIRRKQKVIGCLKKFVAFLFSHVGLAGMVVVYSILGALMFQAIEQPKEIIDKKRFSEMKDVYINQSLDFLYQTLQNLSKEFLNDTEKTESFETELNNSFAKRENGSRQFYSEAFLKFQDNVTNAVKSGGWDGNDEDEALLQWSFPGSLLYAVTVITTIGYGHIAPKTSTGRILTMVYALVGIPLTFLYLSNIGNFLGESLKRICCGVCCCLQCKQRKDREILRLRKRQRILSAQKEITMMTYPMEGGGKELEGSFSVCGEKDGRCSEDEYENKRNNVNGENIANKNVCNTLNAIPGDDTLYNTNSSTLQSRNVKRKSGKNQRNNACGVDGVDECHLNATTKQLAASNRKSDKEKRESVENNRFQEDLSSKKVVVENQLKDGKMYGRSNLSSEAKVINRNIQINGSFENKNNQKLYEAMKETRSVESVSEEFTVKITPPGDDIDNQKFIFTRNLEAGENHSKNYKNHQIEQNSEMKSNHKTSIGNRDRRNLKSDKSEGRTCEVPRSRRHIHRQSRSSSRLSKLQRLAKYFSELEETAILSDDHESLIDECKEDESNVECETSEQISSQSNINFRINGISDKNPSNEKNDSFNDKKNNCKYIKKPVTANQNCSIRRIKKSPMKNGKLCQGVQNERDERIGESQLKRVETAPESITVDKTTNNPVSFYIEEKDNGRDVKDSVQLNGEASSKKESSVHCGKEKFFETTHGFFNRNKRKTLKKSHSLHQSTPPSSKLFKDLPDSSLKDISKDSIFFKDKYRNKSFKRGNRSFEKSKNNSETSRDLRMERKNAGSEMDTTPVKIRKVFVDLKKSSSIKEDNSKQLFLSASLKIRPASVIGLKSLLDVSTHLNENTGKISPTLSYIMMHSMKKSLENHLSKSEGADVRGFENEISPEAANLLFRDQALLDFDDEDETEKLHDQKVTVPIYVCLIIIISYIFIGAMLFSFWEKWDYIASYYFCFITLSTIGFGDIVPGTDMSSWASNVKLVSCTLWLAFGLSLLAMCFDLMQEGVKDKCRMIGKKVGLLKKEE